MTARTLERKNKDKVVSFSALFFNVYTNVDNKERARASYENKGDEFRRKKNMKIQSGGEKMRKARGQQGENERQWK